MTFAIDHIDGGFRPAFPDRRRATRIAACIALSLAAHTLLLATYRQSATPRPAAAPERLTVRLRPAAPPAPPAPSSMDIKPAEKTPPAPVPRAQKPARASRPVIAVEPDQRRSTEETHAVKPAPPPTAVPAATAPRFDLDAARSMARGMAAKLADEPDPDKVGTALERLPKPSLQTEDKFERAIKSAKRPDCKDGVPGGLLAPLFLAMDKKDSGCKW